MTKTKESKELKLARYLQLIQLFKILSHHICYLGVRDFICSPGTCSIDLNLDKHTVVYITLEQVCLNQYKLSVYAKIYSKEQDRYLRNKKITAACTKTLDRVEMLAHIHKLPKLLTSFLKPRPQLKVVSRRLI